MLLGSQFPNTSGVAKTGNFTLLSPNYNELSDLRPGKPTLFQQTVSGSQTLTLTKTLVNDAALDFNTVPYPYLILGIIGIGNAPYEGQILPAVNFSANGKWGNGGANVKSCQAQVGPSGLASAFAIFKASEKVGATPTTTATAALTANFQTAFGNFGLGEFVVIGCDEVPINSITEPIVNQNQTSRASNRTPSLTLRDAYRNVSVNFAPLSRGNARGVPNSANFARNLRDALYAATRNGACFIAPEWRMPGTPGPDLPTLMECGYLANLMSPNPSLMFNAADASGMYRGSAAFEELA